MIIHLCVCAVTCVGHVDYRPHLSLSVSALVVCSLVDPDSSRMLVHIGSSAETLKNSVIISHFYLHGSGVTFPRWCQTESMIIHLRLL